MPNKTPVKSLNTKEYDALLAVLKEAREEAGVSQIDLSIAVGHHASFVTKIEAKERRLDVAEFYLLTQGLKVDPIALFTRYVERIRSQSEPLED